MECDSFPLSPLAGEGWGGGIDLLRQTRKRSRRDGWEDRAGREVEANQATGLEALAEPG
jgi:hypothetical protein